MNFRNVNVQNIFKTAAQCDYIHILATIDHIHAPLSNTYICIKYVCKLVFS